MTEYNHNQEDNIYNYHQVVGINEEGEGYQVNLNNKAIPKLRMNLTDNQLRVLIGFYDYNKPLTQGDMFAVLKGKIHLNTIARAIKLLEYNGLIKRVRSGMWYSGKIAHTIADSRYKYYVLTPEGENETENQLNVRPNNLEPL